MIRRLFLTLIAGAAAMPVLAVTCYEVIDRTDNVIFRDSQSPVDLSAAGAPLRDAMYRRGEQLIIFDTNACAVIGQTTQTGIKKLTVDEIVAEWRVFSGPSSWGTYSSRYGGSPTLVQSTAATPPDAPTPSPAPGRSTSSVY